MKNLGYYNGIFGELDKIRIPICDRVCFFGDGVYDSCYCVNRKIFAFDEHIDRFYNSAKIIGIDIQMQKSELKNIIYDMIKHVDSDKQFVYWQISRGTNPRDHLFDEDIKPNLWIILQPKEIKDFRLPISAITLPDRRFSYCNAKTTNLIPNVIASDVARKNNAFEAIFHIDGIVTECSHSNVHILKNGLMITAPLSNKILDGITRRHIINICKNNNIEVEERNYTLQELFDADEIFISSAGAMGLRVNMIDGKSVGCKDLKNMTLIQTELNKEFENATRI